MGYQIGTRYDVLTLRIGVEGAYLDGKTLRLSHYMGFTGFLPLLNPPSQDEDFFGFAPYHAHIDWRFLSKRWYRHFARVHAQAESLLTCVIDLKDQLIPQSLLTYRRLRCQRALPALPDYPEAHWYPDLAAQYPCAALVNGKCPHRGTPAEAMIEQDGRLVCPAHGLRLNRATIGVSAPAGGCDVSP